MKLILQTCIKIIINIYLFPATNAHFKYTNNSHVSNFRKDQMNSFLLTGNWGIQGSRQEEIQEGKGIKGGDSFMEKGGGKGEFDLKLKVTFTEVWLFFFI